MAYNYSLLSKSGYIGTKSILFIFLIFSAMFSRNIAMAQDADGIPTDEATIASGEKLFKANCTVCHAVNERVIGPALRDIHKRRPLDWIQAFVKNSQKVIKSGDEYAVKLYNEYNKTEMTAFDFENAEITSMVAYLKAESSKEVVVATVETTAVGTETTGNDQASTMVNIAMIVLLVILFAILIVLIMVISLLKKFANQKEDISEEDKEIANQSLDLVAIFKSNAFLAMSSFIIVAVLMKAGIDGLFTVGVQQGYQPTQPIAYSHKVHAGEYKIDCNYCHTGVRKSKSATYHHLIFV